jgi:hypothetical protein
LKLVRPPTLVKPRHRTPTASEELAIESVWHARIKPRPHEGEAVRLKVCEGGNVVPVRNRTAQLERGPCHMSYRDTAVQRAVTVPLTDA